MVGQCYGIAPYIYARRPSAYVPQNEVHLAPSVFLIARIVSEEGRNRQCRAIIQEDLTCLPEHPGLSATSTDRILTFVRCGAVYSFALTLTWGGTVQ